MTASGAGVDVFQPFEVVQGSFDATPIVRDGDQAILLPVSLAPGEAGAFTIDIDNTTSPRGITAFGPDAAARVPVTDCLS